MPETQKIDRSISLLWANVFGIVWFIPVALLFLPLYGTLWGDTATSKGLASLLVNPLIFLLVFAGGIILHEALHGLTWQWRTGQRGVVQYGVKWQMLTPYAHLKQPIAARDYRIGTLMPGLIIGLLPILIALASGSDALFWFGLLFIWAAGGDVLVLWVLRDLPATALVEDHPSRVGCYVLLDEDQQ